ncbi:amidohydrolase [Chthonobacter albigriseus]|uniref:amidohydrolase n=1 Tax=Chthonobacter albigriseus TaxID=1683161 RepID=UPI0015EF52A1|nr:amidohydrolase [Chthonobacter albigriseus]
MNNADLVIVNGRVRTVDPSKPFAEAVAILGNRIAAVGDNAEILALKGSATRVFDAAGRTVLPGFVESHLHVFPGGLELDHCDLSGVRGVFAVSEKIRGYVATRPGSDLVIGQAADYTMLSDQAITTRQDLDAILPDRPLLLFAPDHHTAWANTAALAAAGILHGKPVGVGNEIVMAPDGTASGELREGEAFGPVLALSKVGTRVRQGLTNGGEPEPPTPEERAADRAVMKRGLEHLARHGITSFHNMDGNFYQLELIDELIEAGDFICRARVPMHFVDAMPIEALEKASAMTARYDSDRLRSGFVKLFMDGVIDSGTAAMLEDYADRPGWRGDPLFTAERFNAIATEADRRGLQIAVHAIGDRAVRMVLDGYEAARKANGVRDSRHRIEHIEVIHPDDIPRLVDYGVMASMQPPHPPGAGNFPLEPTVSKIGEHRWPWAYAWNTIRDAGGRLVFASDWPVSPVSVTEGIQAAVTRPSWKEGLRDHRQTLDQAIAGYTIDGAYTEFMEDRKGMLKPGYLADVVVLSGDIDATPPQEIGGLQVALTVCDGIVTWEG